MSIAVTLLSGPEDAPVKTVIFPDQGGVIGRGSGCRLVIPDKKRSVSKRHAFVERVGDQLYLTDLSTNGTYPFGKVEKIGRGVTIEADDGARFHCADYTFEVKLSEEPAPAQEAAEQPAAEAPAAVAPAAPPPPKAEAGDPQAVVDGLFEGLQIDPKNLDLADPHAFGKRAGEILRHGLATVALAMRMRAHVKGSMHAEVTQLMPSQPNPLKISLNEVDALEAMLGPAHIQFQDPASALHDVQDELREHELAVLKAVRTTLRKLLTELDPDKLLQAAEEQSKGPFAAKHKKAWEGLVEAYSALDNNDYLDTLFGRTYSEELKKG